MQRRLNCLLLLAACAANAGFAQPGYAQKKITVRVIDGRTGEAVTPDNLEVRINRQQAYHLEFVKMNDDGTAELMLPDNATALALRATYDNSMEYYVNCDVAQQKNTASQTWFPVEDVLKDGLLMPDECRKGKNMPQAHHAGRNPLLAALPRISS
jgi:hypothetical protein